MLAGREGRRACSDTGASRPAGLHAEAGAQRGRGAGRCCADRDAQAVPRGEAEPRLPSHRDRCSRRTGGCSCVPLCQGGRAAGRPAGRASHVSNMIPHSVSEGKRACWAPVGFGSERRWGAWPCRRPLGFCLSPFLAGLASFSRISNAVCPSQDSVRKPRFTGRVSEGLCSERSTFGTKTCQENKSLPVF